MDPCGTRRVQPDVFHKMDPFQCILLKGDVSNMYPDWPLADLFVVN